MKRTPDVGIPKIMARKASSKPQTRPAHAEIGFSVLKRGKTPALAVASFKADANVPEVDVRIALEWDEHGELKLQVSVEAP